MASISLRKTLKTNSKIKIYHIDNVNSAQMVLINLRKHCISNASTTENLKSFCLYLVKWRQTHRCQASPAFGRPVCPVYTQIHICLKCSIVLTMYANRNAYYLKYKKSILQEFWVFQNHGSKARYTVGLVQWYSFSWVWYPDNPTKPQPVSICLLPLYL